MHRRMLPAAWLAARAAARRSPSTRRAIGPAKRQSRPSATSALDAAGPLNLLRAWPARNTSALDAANACRFPRRLRQYRHTSTGPSWPRLTTADSRSQSTRPQTEDQDTSPTRRIRLQMDTPRMRLNRHQRRKMMPHLLTLSANMIRLKSPRLMRSAGITKGRAMACDHGILSCTWTRYRPTLPITMAQGQGAIPRFGAPAMWRQRATCPWRSFGLSRSLRSWRPSASVSV